MKSLRPYRLLWRDADDFLQIDWWRLFGVALCAASGALSIWVGLYTYEMIRGWVQMLTRVI